jgi:D-glycero-D-manno-heptose 1,7-bisphosphate phosphatase
MRPAVFFDRDGVLSKSLFRPDGKPVAPWTIKDFTIENSAAECVTRIKEAGYLAIVVTNQPDVGKGIVSQEEVEKMHQILSKKVPIDDIEVCYATRLDGSARMKPSPGMLFDAAKKWKIDLAQSVMIGDRSGDIAAGQAAGCLMTILIDRKYPEPELGEPTYRVSSLEEAVELILKSTVDNKKEKVI